MVLMVYSPRMLLKLMIWCLVLGLAFAPFAPALALLLLGGAVVSGGFILLGGFSG